MSKLTRRTLLQSAVATTLAAPLVTYAPSAAAQAAPPAGGLGEAKFRLGIVTYNVAAQWDVPTILKVCKNVGIAAVELRTTHKHGVEPALSKEQRAEVRKQFADAGMRIWGCGTTCEFHAPDPAVVQRNVETCKTFCQLVADLGGRGVKVRPNGLPKEVPAEKTLDQIGKALIDCGQAAGDAGVEIHVEVHGGGTSQPPNMAKIMQACAHKSVGVTWNSNPGDVKDGSVAESFNLLRPWIRSVHINELWKQGTGAYPYRELFRLLRETGYDRVTLCEVGRTPPDVASGEEMLRYYKALWTELNR